MRKSLLLLLLTGCSVFHSNQMDEGKRTRVTILSFFDSHNEVTKLKTTQTDKSQGIGVGSISENTSGTNAVEALRIIRQILDKVP